jgi:predicted translin family RNA/ssDNA-binding protein
MNYKNELLDKIRSKEYLPNFARPNFLSELNNRAGEAFLQNNLHGYLSAVTIYHYMKEEMLKALFRKFSFYIRLKRFPERVFVSDENCSVLNYPVNEMYETADFKNRDEILKLSKEMDNLKAETLRRLAEGCCDSELEDLANCAKEIYTKLFKAFRDSNLWFYRNFSSFEKSCLSDGQL